jgi:hypothetical protein
MRISTKTAALAAVAALALPAGAAQAHQTGEEHSHGNTTQQSNRCDRTPTVGFTARGTFVSLSGSTLTANVTRGNRNARRYYRSQDETLPSEQTFTVGPNTRVRFGDDITDTSGNGTVGFEDLQSGTTYNVRVVGRVAKPKRNCANQTQTPPTIRRVVVTLAQQS